MPHFCYFVATLLCVIVLVVAIDFLKNFLAVETFAHHVWQSWILRTATVVFLAHTGTIQFRLLLLLL